MKKFLVFLVSIIVALCLGMTFYYFAKDEEVIKIQTSTLYLNIGDSVSLDDLGFSHTHKKQETKINFNAGGDLVTSIISYDSSLKKYIATEKGGATTIVISTNNKKFKKFYINVVIGNGSEETPFQIKTEEDLFNVGTSRFMDVENQDAHYILMNDITLTQKHNPIGVDENGTSKFQGNFDGNYYIISNLQTNENIYGGLFAVIGENASVKNLYLQNPTIEGSYTNAGALAGVINGYVDRIGIIDPIVNNSNSSQASYTGAIAGKVTTVKGQTSEIANIATVLRMSVESSNENSLVRGNGYVGGIAGEIDDAIIEGLKIATNIHATSGSLYCGGFAGNIILNEEGFVRESYSLSSIDSRAQKSGALFGYIDIPSSATIALNNVLLGLYYDNTATTLKTYNGTNSLELTTNLKTVDGLSESKLITPTSYIYYYSDPDDDSSAKYWSESIWKRMDGQYPILRYTEYAIPSNITISTNKKDDTYSPDISNPTTPDNPSDDITTNPDTPITTPDLPKDDTNGITEISTAETLKNVTFMSNSTYKLTADINLNGYEWTGKKLPKGATFDGNGHTISNFKIKRGTNYVGFFSSVVGSVVKGVKFENVTVDTTLNFDYVGIVAGVVDNGTILSTTINKASINYTGTTTANFAGGIVGYCSKRSALVAYNTINNITISGNIKYVGGLAGYIGQNTSLQNSNVAGGTLSGNAFVGGLVGQNDGLIAGCTANININNSYSNASASYIGGLVGANCNQIISYTENSNKTISQANVSITISNSSSSHIYYVGGIAGYNRYSSLINECLAQGNDESIKVSSNAGIVNIGGIVGLNAGNVTNCINKMSGIGSTVSNVISAGLVGQNTQGSITGCLTTANVFGDDIGGLVGININGGQIASCAVGTNNIRVTLKGNMIAGLCYYSASGSIKDCYANVSTNMLALEGTSAGAVAYLPVNANNAQDYCTVSHCIISCEFTGLGNKERYLVTASNIMSSKARSTGTITNCIFDVSANGASAATKPSGKASKAVSKSSYATSASIELTLTTASQYGFDISNNTTTTWYYDATRTSFPILSRFVNY